QVMAAGRTTTRAAMRARHAVEEAHGNVVGAVLNFCSSNDGDDYYSYYYYYDYGASNGARGLARFFHPQRRAKLSAGPDHVDEEVRR
ncbi:MAG: hypothetical protein LC772_01680, partial [Chloroflexi bacterium]|nr:hypothetical protein [Chloroflexota bacterium]